MFNLNLLVTPSRTLSRRLRAGLSERFLKAGYWRPHGKAGLASFASADPLTFPGEKALLGPWACPCAPISVRHKYTRKSAKEKDRDEDSESEEEDEEFDDKSSKLIKSHMTSLRVDNIIKSGLGLARNKVETLFYESRIRINGCKIPKKSFRAEIGDEIDVIKGPSPMNEDFLNISRVVVVSSRANDEGDGLVVKLRRFKTLTIENYPGHPWKS